MSLLLPPRVFSIVLNHIKKRSHSKRIIYELQVWVMAFNQLTTMEEFEICIWRNEFPCDLILDRMVTIQSQQSNPNNPWRGKLFVYLLSSYLFCSWCNFPLTNCYFTFVVDSWFIWSLCKNLEPWNNWEKEFEQTVCPVSSFSCRLQNGHEQFQWMNSEKLLTKILFFYRVELAGNEQPR